MRNRIFDIVVLVLLIGQGHEYAQRYPEWDTLDYVMLFCFSYIFFYLISRYIIDYKKSKSERQSHQT